MAPPAHTPSAADSSKPSGEHREPGPQPLLGLAAQLVAPVDERAQRLLPGQRRPAPAGEQAEPVVQAVGELLDGQRAQPRRGELDRQRHAVEAARTAATTAARFSVGDARSPARPRRARSSSSAIASYWPSAAAGGGRCGSGQRQRRHGDDVLAGDAQRLAAGREHPQAGRGAEQPVDEPGARLDHVLAVVEHEQELRGRRGGRRAAPRRAAPTGPAPRARSRRPAPPGRRCSPARDRRTRPHRRTRAGTRGRPPWPAASCPPRPRRSTSPAGIGPAGAGRRRARGAAPRNS